MFVERTKFRTIGRDQTLYKHGQVSNDCGYFILYGSMALLDGNDAHINIAEQRVTAAGEQALVDAAADNAKGEKKQALKRNETVLALNDCYVLEMTRKVFDQMKELMISQGLAMDWFSIVNYLKNEIVSKRRMHMRHESLLLQNKLSDI